jgi:hypothetical protein
MSVHDEIRGLRARIEVLETVIAEAYQFAGAVGAPVRVLDQFDAAANDRPLPHATILPVSAEECVQVARTRRTTLAAVMGRAGGQARSRAKTAAARANGAKGGRPPKRKAS